jgi:hypothetical protein
MANIGQQCTPIPPGFFPALPLPPGVGIPTFTPPTVTFGFCCNIQFPPWGTFPLPFPPIPPGFLTAIAAYISSIEDLVGETFDAVAIPCPTQ